MADWVPAPENNPWLLPDGTKVRMVAEGTRRTVGGPAHPGTTVQTPLIKFDAVHATWQYWSPVADPGPSDYLRGWDAGVELYRCEAAAGQQDRAALILAGWGLAGGGLVAVGHLATGGLWWAVAYAAIALAAGGFAVRAAVTACRIRKEAPDAH